MSYQASFRRLRKHELDLADRMWLHTMKETLPWGTEIEDWMDDASLHFFRVEGRVGGLLLCQVLIHKDGKELLLVGFAATRWNAGARVIREHILELARGANCKWVGAYMANLKLAKLMASFGMKLVSARMTMEIEQ